MTGVSLKRNIFLSREANILKYFPADDGLH